MNPSRRGLVLDGHPQSVRRRPRSALTSAIRDDQAKRRLARTVTRHRDALSGGRVVDRKRRLVGRQPITLLDLPVPLDASDLDRAGGPKAIDLLRTKVFA